MTDNEPEPAEEEGPTATIVYSGGSEVVEDFFMVEERMDATDPYADMPDGEQIPVVRVWYSDPSLDDDDYVDYDYGNIVEVVP